ncbi:MAG: type II toxin-antitoxin system HicA family toxin [Atribacterota bacterium]|jgi:predicted RNA binding protein YcfA (HicA-like mRNA interferase family)|nr:type II toxin-antitoxin system HicA family toxin [Atribacterota bacterium]MDD3641143.1 type II toxin-antitoxin system HicA family toxin [Atribacterota bacterium]MDD4289619.1 type II toxin-antitoxin system HicA family toxin [Atribacterota bacterium]MDD5635550.1 type II toxin-antitoxin system HicA family toxin [Atribacterota bacterium]MDI9597854.1 type II toxin-antitoxin system HicA family toxin [Atribacterota bacterium]
MPKINPISFHVLVKKLKKFGYKGPFSGGKHLFMIKNDIRLTIPNPHKKSDIGIDLLAKILKIARISKEEWLEK